MGLKKCQYKRLKQLLYQHYPDSPWRQSWDWWGCNTVTIPLPAIRLQHGRVLELRLSLRRHSGRVGFYGKRNPTATRINVGFAHLWTPEPREACLRIAGRPHTMPDIYRYLSGQGEGLLRQIIAETI